MKRILIFQTLIAAAGSCALWFCGPHQMIGSYVLGVLVVAGNFILLQSAWKLIFRKKLIALSVLIIVFKYAILGVIIYHLIAHGLAQPIWFSVGVTSMMVSSLIYGLTLGFFETKDERKEE
jgi:hypothetical protein